jgi:hypothetical protein
MTTPTLYILLTLIISLLASVLTLLFYIRQKKSSYDNEYRRVMLDEGRSSLEKQVYVLNDRLLKNEERWRDINHLLIRKEYLNDQPIVLNKDVVLNDFLESNGIGTQDIIIDRELIFVLTPFHSRFTDDYNTIRQICLDAGFKCYRGDETFFKSDIFPEMLRHIVKANLIIANLNGKNANVMYELGIAQALDKPVILIAKNPENLPIDIRSKRFLVYNDHVELEKLLKDELIKLLKSQVSRPAKKNILTSHFLVGTWLNEWTVDGKTGSEHLKITDDMKYFIRNDFYFNLENIQFTEGAVSFLKVGVKPNDTRRLENKLTIKNSQLLEGTEQNYQIRYTRLSE